MPESAGPVTAVIVSGGKQYRVAPGDRVLVGRLAAEPGAEVTIERVLMHADGDSFKVGNPAIEGLTVTARVIAHSRGPKVMAFRYKSKKNVRVHKGARADYTAIQIVAIGGRREGRKAADTGEAAGTPAARGGRAKTAAERVEASKAEPQG